MNTTPDHKFVDNFSVVLSALVLFMLIIIVIAILIVNHSEVVDQKYNLTYQGVLEERIKPFGDVVIEGQEKTLYGANPGAAMEAATAVAASTDTASTGFSSGEEVYNVACVACHGLGIAGAPKMGDASQWEARVSAGLDTLYDHAINGFSSAPTSIMPAKGGRTDLTDEEVRWSVDYMLEQSQ